MKRNENIQILMRSYIMVLSKNNLWNRAFSILKEKPTRIILFIVYSYVQV
jgi:hypothetical protein